MSYLFPSWELYRYVMGADLCCKMWIVINSWIHALKKVGGRDALNGSAAYSFFCKASSPPSQVVFQRAGLHGGGFLPSTWSSPSSISRIGVWDWPMSSVYVVPSWVLVLNESPVATILQPVTLSSLLKLTEPIITLMAGVPPGTVWIKCSIDFWVSSCQPGPFEAPCVSPQCNSRSISFFPPLSTIEIEWIIYK